MITVFSKDHHLHDCQHEFHRGRLIPCYETPRRAGTILHAVREAELGNIIEPDEFGIEPLIRVHDANYVLFLKEAFEEWTAIHPEDTEIIPHTWCIRRMNQRVPETIYGRVGYYSFDAGTPIVAGTWDAVRCGANTALTAGRLLQDGQPAAFALVRPPGHHAAQDYYGGYCFLNHAAIAAQAFLDGEAKRVAILDIDYHHGNGTQDIFYERDDVLFVSLHASPADEYPYFLGHAEERGAKAGEGFNWNAALPAGTDWSSPVGYRQSMENALDEIASYSADYLVVSLGVDTWEGDPLCTFSLTTRNLGSIGRMIGGLNLPTLFVMEGGYAVDQLGHNVVEVLQGFEQTHSIG